MTKPDLPDPAPDPAPSKERLAARIPSDLALGLRRYALDQRTVEGRHVSESEIVARAIRAYLPAAYLPEAQ